MDTYDVPWVDRVLCRWVEQVGIRKADRLTACSAFLAREVRAKLGVAKEVPVIYNGIDLELFDQSPVADLQAEYGVAEGHTTVLFAGRMEPRKGVHLLGEIVRSVAGRPVTFLLAGDDLFGYVRTTLQPYLRAHGNEDSVKVLGKLGMQELRACARAVDIYLLPSLWENCPYACLEAMAAGRAVVCSHQGGMPELIEHGVNGLLAEVGSAGSFAAELIKLIDDEVLRKRLGRRARETVERRFRDEAIAIESASAYAAAGRAE
jgi:glycosyltransferase involved in cell wall biosynthesis